MKDLLRCASVIGVALVAGSVSAQTRRANPVSRVDSTIFSRTQILSRLGFPSGVSLDGPFGTRTIAFRLPGTAPVDSARLDLKLRFSPGALPQSNVQVFVNEVRRATILRSSADSGGVATLSVRLPGNTLGRDYANVRLRSSVGVTTDRCFDQHVAATFVEIDPATSFTYFAGANALADIRHVWAALPDSATMSLPQRALTEGEFQTALAVSIAAARDGHRISYVRLPTLGDIIIAPGPELDSAAGFTDRPADANVGVFHQVTKGVAAAGIYVDPRRGAVAASLLDAPWAMLGSSPALDVHAAARTDSSKNDLTFADLNIGDLQRDLGAEATWRLAIDVRDFPARRVPSRVQLDVVTAPNTFGREIVAFVFLNGTLVQSADIKATGAPQTIDAKLPSALLSIRNELRVVIQRRLRAAEPCAPEDAPVPAQILPTSRVLTSQADPKAQIFTSVAANLSATSPLYLPKAALSEPVDYLDLVAGLGRAFWVGHRAPHAVFYGNGAPTPPTEAFIAIGRIPSTTLAGPVTSDSGRFRIRRKDGGETLLDVADLRAWSIAQVVRWNSQTGVQLIAPTGRRLVPDWPDAYGAKTLTLANADSTVFSLNTTDQEGSLLFNDGPTLLERARADRVLWILFGILLVAPIVYFTVRAVIRRTPRRRLPPRVDQGGGRSTEPGAPTRRG
jgi:hypothetical protein